MANYLEGSNAMEDYINHDNSVGTLADWSAVGDIQSHLHCTVRYVQASLLQSIV